ncbi:MAG: hypothetical protein KGL41_05565 [Actinomycetales bacterium]|nr:hypothetical protein [Actinomycetales bacterium]
MKTTKKRLGVALSLVVSLLGLQAAVTPAHAAAASGEAYIKLISPVIDDSMISQKAENQKMANSWVDNTWFGSGLTYTVTWAPAGSTINVTYNVSDKDGNPFVNTPVKLRVGKGYSGSTAIVAVDGLKTNGIDKPPFDQANPIRKTDSFGNVSFTLVNLNDVSEGEPQPANWTDKPISNTDLNALYVQIMPEVNGEKPDHSAITEFRLYKPNAPVAAGTLNNPTIRLASPVLTDTNSVHRDDLETLFSVTNSWYAKGIGVRQAYVPVGGSAYMAYSVKDDSGKPVVNKQIKLHVNKAYSGSNGKVSNDGKDATDSTKPNDADQAVWTATTDAFGTAVFLMKNSDTKGEATPATMTAKMPEGKSAVFSQFWPELSGAKDVADMTEFHFYTPPVTVAAVAAAKAVKGKYNLTITVNGPAGASAAVTVTGLAKVTKKIGATNSVSYTVAVPKGVKNVSVLVGGKTYKATVKVG